MSDTMQGLFCPTPDSFVFSYKGKPVIDSLTIAANWKMTHQGVKRACYNAEKYLRERGQVNAVQLIHIDYVDSKGRTQPKILLDETAFFVVVGGFQGAVSTAMRFKVFNEFKLLKEQVTLSKKRGKKPRMLHTAVFNTGSMFADFDRAIGLVELRKIPESEMTAWQKVFSRAYYCTRNYTRMKDKVDKELMPSLRMVLTEVFGKPVSDNLVKLADHREKLAKSPKS